MCTATFYPMHNGRFIFTSNRDEKLTRQPSTRLQRIQRNGIRAICPIDADAGGTWLIATDKGEIWCLLNGAFEKHTYNPPYKRSRGLLLLDAAFSNLEDDWKSTEHLDGMEPFTMLKIQVGSNYNPQVFRWNGHSLIEQTTQPLRPEIWSSATLYSSDSVIQRQEKWEAFTQQNSQLSAAAIRDFHQDKADTCSASLMLKNQSHQTVSVSQLDVSADGINWQYTELLSGLHEQIEFNFKSSHAN
jgi:uncharacterized protein with NRDE domain